MIITWEQDWISEALLFSQSVMNLHNGGADPKSVHRTIESVYIKEEIVQSDPDDDDDDEVRICLKQNA